LDNRFLNKNGIEMIHPIIVGKTLVELNDIEKGLQIAGCVICEKAINRAKENCEEGFAVRWEELITNNKILEYQMPFEMGALNSWIINWEDGTPITLSIEELTAWFSSFNRSVIHPKVQLKIKNTFEYISFVKSKLKD